MVYEYWIVGFLFELEIELSRLIEINKSLQNENERLERDLGIEKEQIKVFQKSVAQKFFKIFGFSYNFRKK